jgi:fatty acid desaturase
MLPLLTLRNTTALLHTLTAEHSFRRYHLEHHSHQGVIGTDMDLPPWFDVVTVRNCTLRKLLWMSGFMFSYGLRPMGWGRTKVCTVMQ